MPPNQVLATFSVVEFANILVTLHTSKPSPSFLLGSLPHPFTQIRTTIASSFHNLVFLFYGPDANNEDGKQDPAKFIETLTFVIDG